MGIADEILIPLNASHWDMCRISSSDDEDVFGIIFPVLRRLADDLLAKGRAQGEVSNKSREGHL